MGFDFCVEYKKGNTNVAVDALSRMGETGELIAISIIDLVWIQELKDSYKEEEDLKHL